MSWQLFRTLSNIPKPIVSTIFPPTSRISTRTMASVNVKNFVDSAIADNKVAIFSKSSCPYCKETKTLFAVSFQDMQPKIMEIDERDDEQEIQDYLKEISGQRSVPNIFINQKHVGGNDTVQAAHKANKLVELIGA